MSEPQARRGLLNSGFGARPATPRQPTEAAPFETGIPATVSDTVRENFTFFFGHEEGKSDRPELSQWYLRDFIIDGITFNCCEQWMMWSKAMLFGDVKMAERILAARTPGEQNALGRKVLNRHGEPWTAADAAIWDASDVAFVFRGNTAKFSQNHDLLVRMATSKGTTLVEASPYDRIWGIGLSARDPKALNRQTWKGRNKLGFVLTEVRIALCGS